MNTERDDATKVQMLDRLIADGVRFQDEQQALMRWFMREHDIIFAQSHTGQWLSKYKTTGVNIGKHATFHELIIDLIQRVTHDPTA